MATHNVTGNHLHDTTLNVSATEGPPETINVRGLTEMNPGLGFFDHLTVNLAANNEWVGGFNLFPNSSAVVNGPGVFDNTSTDINRSSAIIGANVVGTGTFMAFGQGPAGKLEFLHGVSAGQTVVDTGAPTWGTGIVQVDSPGAYHASNVLGFGEIDLEGLKATSYSFKNDLLSLFNGKTVVDTLKLALQVQPDPVVFGVSQVGGSVVVHAEGSFYSDGGQLLALHA
jgi:hypothetical protein